MTPENVLMLAVRARHAAYRTEHSHWGSFACCKAHAAADDVPALLDHIALMRKVITRFDTVFDRVAKSSASLVDEELAGLLMRLDGCPECGVPEHCDVCDPCPMECECETTQ